MTPGSDLNPPPAGGFGGGPGPDYFGPIHEPNAVSSDRLAVIGLVLGALSIPFTLCCFGGVPLGLMAVLVSRQARKKIQAQPHLFHGERSATMGFWLGVSGLGLSLVYVLFQTGLMFLGR